MFGNFLPKNVTHILSLLPRNSTSRYLPRRNENRYSQRDLYKYAHRSFVYNGPKQKVHFHKHKSEEVNCDILIK